MLVSYTFVITSLLSFSWALVFQDSVPFPKRQSIAPGTPLYECHANCGGVILSSQSPNYCSNSTFTSELSACLECALTQNVWQYYGDGVTSAAKNCGDDATPSSSSVVSTAASTASVASTLTSSAVGSAPTGTIGQASSSAVSSSSVPILVTPSRSIVTSASSTPETSSVTSAPSSTGTGHSSTSAAAFSGHGIDWPVLLTTAALASLVHLFL